MRHLEREDLLGNRSVVHLHILHLSSSSSKVARPALERNEDKRAAYQILIAENYLPEQLVFVDESACNRNTTKRRFAWSPIGTRARRHDYFVRGKR